MANGPGATVRLQELPHPAVSSFDAWLVLHTGESAQPVRLWTREDVRAFIRHPNVEALTTEFVQDHARLVMVPGAVKPVSALPKGGWWNLAATFMTEIDVRIIRAVIGMHMKWPGPAAIVQTILGRETTDIPFYTAVGVDRLVEDPPVSLAGLLQHGRRPLLLRLRGEQPDGGAREARREDAKGEEERRRPD